MAGVYSLRGLGSGLIEDGDHIIVFMDDIHVGVEMRVDMRRQDC